MQLGTQRLTAQPCAKDKVAVHNYILYQSQWIPLINQLYVYVLNYPQISPYTIQKRLNCLTSATPCLEYEQQ